MEAFSAKNPALQLAWDSSSLGELMFCAYRYYRLIVEGRRSPDGQIDLDFGRFMASALELYQKARLKGASKEDAQMAGVLYLMGETQTEDGSEQWGGEWETQWHCTGTEPYKNRKGNKAKCPYSHKGAFFPPPAPPICGECGSPIEEVRNYLPDSPSKNRITLVRAFIWWVEEQPKRLEDGVRPIKFEDGTPAVELSWRLPLPLESHTGEQFILSGHFDYIAEFQGDIAPADNKTTTKGLTKGFWAGYSTHYQLDTYDMAVALLWPEIESRGVLVDAIQTMAGGARFGRQLIYKTEAQREEHFRLLLWWIGQADRMAQEGYWPQNKRNCWMCPLKSICARPMDEHEGLLDEFFPKGERWDPLAER